MKKFLILFLFLGTPMAQEVSKEDVEIIIPTDGDQGVQSFSKKVDLPVVDGVDLNEDVPGCADDICRCSLKTLRVMQGPIDLLAMGSTFAAGAINIGCYLFQGTIYIVGNITDVNSTAVASLQQSNQTLNGAAAIMNIVAGSFQAIRAYWQKAVNDETEILKRLIIDSKAKKDN